MVSSAGCPWAHRYHARPAPTEREASKALAGRKYPKGHSTRAMKRYWFLDLANRHVCWKPNQAFPDSQAVIEVVKAVGIPLPGLAIVDSPPCVAVCTGGQADGMSREP